MHSQINKREREKFDAEFSASKILAENGHAVFLLPEIGAGQHPDAVVDGKTTEIKIVKGKIDHVAERFSDAIQKADNVFFANFAKLFTETSFA